MQIFNMLWHIKFDALLNKKCNFD